MPSSPSTALVITLTLTINTQPGGGWIPGLRLRYFAFIHCAISSPMAGSDESFDLVRAPDVCHSRPGDSGTALFYCEAIYRRRVALLAAAFSAITVMQIQQSHFYTTDNFATFFTMLTLYFAAIIATAEWQTSALDAGLNASEKPAMRPVPSFFSRLYHNHLIWWCAIFGLALGMAAASKLNAAAVAITLPIALVVRYFKFHHHKTDTLSDNQSGQAERTPFEDFIGQAIIAIIIGAVVSLISFRVFQPYAFSGPGFFNISIDANWISKVREQLSMASPNADLVWALQWAKRTHLFSFENLTVWGLGLPLGILAWAGFIWMAWRMIKGDWLKHILLWSWTGIYFTWQSLQYNPTMRYQLPIYPLLGMMAAWVVFYFVEPRLDGLKRINWKAVLSISAGAVVLILTFCWAFAFSNIYVRTEPRVAATNWIFQNVAAPIDLQILTPSGGTYKQPLPFPSDRTVQAGSPYQAVFVAQTDGTLNSINFAHIIDSDQSGNQTLTVTLTSSTDPAQGILANLNVTTNFAASPDFARQPDQSAAQQPGDH